jgi:hypothetical protein
MRACTDGVATRGRLPSVPGAETFHAVFVEAGPPAGNRGRAGVQLLFDLPIAETVGQSQNQTRTEHIAGGKSARLRPARQFLPLIVGKKEHVAILSHAL